MKKIFLLIVTIVMLSCNYIPTSKSLDSPYIVRSIDEFYTNEKLCVYQISTGAEYAYYNDDLSVVDSIGKFSIGDSVYISLNKK